MSFIMVILFSLLICAAHTSNEVINKLLSELDIKHSNIIRLSSINQDKNLLKTLSYQDNYSRALQSTDVNIENNNVILISTHEIKQQEIQWFLNHNHFHKMLIINPDGIKSQEELCINIDQEVYFYDETTSEVLEAYEINGLKIERTLGHYNVSKNSFIWNPSKQQIIFERRANFHGLKLKGMVEDFRPAVLIDKKYKQKARFFQYNQTYLMHGLVKGVYIDILEHLQENLNFSTVLYKRNDTSYRNIIDWKNGTMTGEGMISDIFFERADMIIAAVLITEKRSIYIDILRPLLPVKWGLYISKGAVHDSMEYDNYFKAFNFYSWATILFAIIMIGIIKCFIFVCIGKNTSSYALTGLKSIWCAMKPIFGGQVSNPDIDSRVSQNIILFVWSLCGSIIWIYYTSQFTAFLSISNPNKPFHNLESMANTNWR